MAPLLFIHVSEVPPTDQEMAHGLAIMHNPSNKTTSYWDTHMAIDMGNPQFTTRSADQITLNLTRRTKSEASKYAIVQAQSQLSCSDPEARLKEFDRSGAKTEGAKSTEDKYPSQASSIPIHVEPKHLDAVAGQTVGFVPLNIIPRGLQVKSYDADILSKGFPYPKVLLTSGISKEDWTTFQTALVVPLQQWLDSGSGERIGVGIGYEVDNVLDVVADWDQKVFRNHGFLMRLDMPGEEKYGLDSMDLYYEGSGNRKTFNIGIGKVGKFEKGKMKDKKLKVLLRAREKLFCGTRIVLDTLSILNSQKLYEQRGWGQWDRQCAAAKIPLPTTGPATPTTGTKTPIKNPGAPTAGPENSTTPTTGPGYSPISPQTPAAGTETPAAGTETSPTYTGTPTAGNETPTAGPENPTTPTGPESTTPSPENPTLGPADPGETDQGIKSINTLMTQRVDRWPPCKHLYYDRWRCKRTTVVIGSHDDRFTYTTFDEPDSDSMDQRGHPRSDSVVSCDDLPSGIVLTMSPSQPQNREVWQMA